MRYILTFLLCLFLASPAHAWWLVKHQSVADSAAPTEERLYLDTSEGQRSVGGTWVSTSSQDYAGFVEVLKDDSDSTYVYKPTGSAVSNYLEMDDTSQTCTGGEVVLHVRASSSAAGDPLRIFLFDDSGYHNYDLGAVLTTSPADYESTAWISDTNDPGQDWDVAAINDLGFGYRDNLAHTGTIEIYEMWLVWECP